VGIANVTVALFVSVQPFVAAWALTDAINSKTSRHKSESFVVLGMSMVVTTRNTICCYW
jgi:hypothetical protein